MVIRSRMFKNKTDEFILQQKQLIYNLNNEVESLKFTKNKLLFKNEKLKIRVDKISKNRGKVEFGIKICELCNLEYVEDTNMNWSCKSH